MEEVNRKDSLASLYKLNVSVPSWLSPWRAHSPSRRHVSWSVGYHSSSPGRAAWRPAPGGPKQTNRNEIKNTSLNIWSAPHIFIRKKSQMDISWPNQSVSECTNFGFKSQNKDFVVCEDMLSTCTKQLSLLVIYIIKATVHKYMKRCSCREDDINVAFTLSKPIQWWRSKFMVKRSTMTY